MKINASKWVKRNGLLVPKSEAGMFNLGGPGSAIFNPKKAAPNGGGGGGTQFATITDNGANRSDTIYWVGFQFAVGATNLTVTTLQRMAMGAMSTANHTVSIFSSSGIVATGIVNMSGVAIDSYASVSITPVVLLSGQEYVIAVDETVGDMWLNETPLTVGAGCTQIGAMYDAGIPASSLDFTQGASAGVTYSGPNFLYQ